MPQIDVSANYFRLRVENPKQFKQFRTMDVGEKGRTEIILGNTGNQWKIQSYRFHRNTYFLKKGKIYGKDAKAKSTLDTLKRKNPKLRRYLG